MKRKVFITALGNALYDEIAYKTSDSSFEYKTRFAPIASMIYNGVQNWTEEDFILVLLTKDAERKSWSAFQEEVKRIGLKCLIDGCEIPNGDNENELWNIFDTLYAKIEDNDNLYFDVTYSFRILPMLILVFGSYTSFLKKTEVCRVTYGNYFSKVLMDLTVLNDLQKWTFATGSFLKNGSTKELKELSDFGNKRLSSQEKQMREFTNSLEMVISERRTCRGIGIIESDEVEKLKHNDIHFDTYPAFSPLIDKIRHSMDSYQSHSLVNIHESAKWCYENGLYIETETLLDEGMVTRLCMDIGIDWKNEDLRKYINQGIKVFIKPSSKKEIGFVLELAERIKKLDYPEVKSVFGGLSDYRNDLNHCGMRGNGKGDGKEPLDSSVVEKKVGKMIVDLERFFHRQSPNPPKRLFVNYSGISVSESIAGTGIWTKDHVQAALDYGFFVELSLTPPKDGKVLEEKDIRKKVSVQLEKINKLNLGISKENSLIYLGSMDNMGEMKKQIRDILQKQGYPVTDTLPCSDGTGPVS